MLAISVSRIFRVTSLRLPLSIYGSHAISLSSLSSEQMFCFGDCSGAGWFVGGGALIVRVSSLFKFIYVNI